MRKATAGSGVGVLERIRTSVKCDMSGCNKDNVQAGIKTFGVFVLCSLI